jgi:hypothetical protein
MKEPDSSNNFRKPSAEMERARERVSMAERSVERAKAESKAAKEKRVEAKKAARKAKKRLRRAKKELAEARHLLAETKAAVIPKRARPPRAKKKPEPNTPAATQPSLKPIQKRRRPAKPRLVAAAADFSPATEPAAPAASHEPVTTIPENESSQMGGF